MWLKDCEDGVTISVRVIPNAPRYGVDPGPTDFLKVRLTAPPVEGRANKALLKFLGKLLRVAPSHIRILRGQGSREKLLLVEGVDAARVRECLGVS